MLVAALAAGAGSAAFAQGSAAPEAQPDLPVQTQGLDVEEHVGQSLPMDLIFRNAEGKQVRLGDYFKDGKPAIMALVYYKCPVICNVVMARMAETINTVDFTIGKDYNALIFSFDPTETTTRDAAQTKLGFVSGYSKEVTPEVEAGWQFHTCSDELPAQQLGEALGFKFRKIDNGKYSHPTALFIITPQGKISRYLYGFEYPARDVKLALMEASEGKLVKTVGDRIRAYCYLYDSTAGKYTVRVQRVMQVSGILTAGGMGVLIGALFLGERIRRSRSAPRAPHPAESPTIITVSGTPAAPSPERTGEGAP